MNAEDIVRAGLLVIQIYAAVGLLFALVFVFWLVGRIDPAARGGSILFRVIIIPGVALLWPLFAVRLLRDRREPPTEANAHRLAARGPSS